MSNRTLDNCSLIKRNVNKGIGEPEQHNRKCLGYGGDMDEPCDKCKECKLYESHEESK